MSKIIHIIIINCWFYLLYIDVFTTIHKHPLFMTPSWRTTFRLLAHISLLQYSRSSNVSGFRRTLAQVLQDINVLALHGPNRWKIIIDQIKAKNWKGFWHGQVLIIQINLDHFFFLQGESCSSWCRGKFNLFMFYLYIIIFL